MKGSLAPFVLAARYTSFLGPGTHSTAPLDVSEYDHAVFEFWRGSLAGSGSAFKAYFEQADEPGPDPADPMDPPVNPWTKLTVDPVDTADDVDLISLTFSKRYMRMRVGLSGNEAAITLFAVGSIRRRVPVTA